MTKNLKREIEVPAGFQTSVDSESRYGPLWQEAAAYGFDMFLVEDNLLKTPAERVRAHTCALNEALALREAMRRTNGS
jgi:hypothetical protein